MLMDPLVPSTLEVDQTPMKRIRRLADFFAHVLAHRPAHLTSENDHAGALLRFVVHR
jgi:hypothetical protein